MTEAGVKSSSQEMIFIIQLPNLGLISPVHPNVFVASNSYRHIFSYAKTRGFIDWEPATRCLQQCFMALVSDRRSLLSAASVNLKAQFSFLELQKHLTSGKIGKVPACSQKTA